MFNVSAAMGGHFADQVSEFTEKVLEIGPNPLAKERSATGKSQIETIDLTEENTA